MCQTSYLDGARASCTVLVHAVQMEVKEVFYAYATRKGTPALRGVSLTMEPGKLLALVGLSGSGKSTLVALLERLYDPDAGQVRAPSLPGPLLALITITLPASDHHRLSRPCLMRLVCCSCVGSGCQARHAGRLLLQAEAC